VLPALRDSITKPLGLFGIVASWTSQDIVETRVDQSERTANTLLRPNPLQVLRKAADFPPLFPMLRARCTKGITAESDP
jgi:hypothetical protein